MSWSMTLGELLSSLVALLALIVAYLVANSQIKLNKRLLLTNSVVAVDAEVTSTLIPETNNNEPYWGLQIFNVGKSIMYLSEYTFDGKKYTNINRILSPDFGTGHVINLPPVEKHVDGDIPQHHIELILSDVENQKYTCLIDVRFINGKWKEEVTRCNKILSQ